MDVLGLHPEADLGIKLLTLDPFFDEGGLCCEACLSFLSDDLALPAFLLGVGELRCPLASPLPGNGGCP